MNYPALIVFAAIPLLLTWIWRDNWCQHFKHDKLGWGFPGSYIGFDGCSKTAYCKLCKYALLQDSQGNWFHIGREEQ